MLTNEFTVTVELDMDAVPAVDPDVLVTDLSGVNEPVVSAFPDFHEYVIEPAPPEMVDVPPPAPTEVVPAVIFPIEYTVDVM